MELPQIIKLMTEPEKLVDPQQVNLLSSWIGEFISHYEEELNEQNYQVSALWGELRKELKHNTEADRAIETTKQYRDREKTKLTLAKLRRYRGDLRGRFEVLSMVKRF